MKLPDNNASALGHIPLPAWANVLSLDAVFVAVVWQQLLMRVFCNRSTRWSEGVALSLSVWLIYVADRLLDGAKLKLERPHTLRHRFYRRHRNLFIWLWVLGLAINTLVVVRLLPTELMRSGLLLAAAVLVYGASVHFSSKRSRSGDAVSKLMTGEAAPGSWQRLTTGVPKEVRVGVLFALGVSLSTWTQLISDLPNQPGNLVPINTAVWPLLVTTCGLAFIFSWNCILVARFEREFDRAQSFASIATHPGRSLFTISGRGSHACLAMALVALAALILLRVPLPVPIEIASLASALGLVLSRVLPAGSVQRISKSTAPCGSPANFDVRGAWVDAVLWTPPLVLLCWM